MVDIVLQVLAVAIPSLIALFKILKDIKGSEERTCKKIEDLSNNVKILTTDYDDRCLEDNWGKELRKIADSAKDFLSSDEILLNFAIYKAERFIEHAMTSIHIASIDNYDYVYERGSVILNECLSLCSTKMNKEFTSIFYEKHIMKALDFAENIKIILEDRYNDKKRRLFIESAKFLQTFLRDIHDVYYKRLDKDRESANGIS